MKSFKKAAFVGGMVFLFVAATGGIALCLTDIPEAAGSLERNQQRAKAAGLFLSMDDYVASFSLPEGDNAAGLINPILREYADRYQDDSGVKETLSLTDGDSVLRAYKGLESFWGSVDRAERWKGCIFERDRHLLAETTYPEYARFKGVVKLACARADIAVGAGDLRTAQECWKRAAILANFIDDEPVWIGMLVQVTCFTVIEESMRAALTAHGQSPEWRSAIRSVLTLIDKPIDFKAVVRYQHLQSIQDVDAVLRPPPKQPGDCQSYAYAVWESKIPGMGAASKSRIHQLMAAFASQLNSDPYDYPATLKACRDLDTSVTGAASFRIVSFVLPGFERAYDAATGEYARRNTLMQAIGLLENPKLKDLPLKGRYALDSDGKPLRIVLQKGGLVVYSLGPNLADDGGQIEKKVNGTSTRDYDFGVRIPR